MAHQSSPTRTSLVTSGSGGCPAPTPVKQEARRPKGASQAPEKSSQAAQGLLITAFSSDFLDGRSCSEKDCTSSKATSLYLQTPQRSGSTNSISGASGRSAQSVRTVNLHGTASSPLGRGSATAGAVAERYRSRSANSVHALGGRLSQSSSTSSQWKPQSASASGVKPWRDAGALCCMRRGPSGGVRRPPSRLRGAVDCLQTEHANGTVESSTPQMVSAPRCADSHSLASGLDTTLRAVESLQTEHEHGTVESSTPQMVSAPRCKDSHSLASDLDTTLIMDVNLSSPLRPSPQQLSDSFMSAVLTAAGSEVLVSLDGSPRMLDLSSSEIATPATSSGQNVRRSQLTVERGEMWRRLGDTPPSACNGVEMESRPSSASSQRNGQLLPTGSLSARGGSAPAGRGRRESSATAYTRAQAQAHAQRRSDDIGIACGKRADTELSLPGRGGGSSSSRNGSARGKRGESELTVERGEMWRGLVDTPPSACNGVEMEGRPGSARSQRNGQLLPTGSLSARSGSAPAGRGRSESSATAYARAQAQAHGQRRRDDIGIACGKRADTELSLPGRGGGSSSSRNGSARGKRGESELTVERGEMRRRLVDTPPSACNGVEMEARPGSACSQRSGQLLATGSLSARGGSAPAGRGRRESSATAYALGQAQAQAQRRRDDIGIACAKRADTELSQPCRGGGSSSSRNGSARGKRCESELTAERGEMWRRLVDTPPSACNSVEMEARPDSACSQRNGQLLATGSLSARSGSAPAGRGRRESSTTAYALVHAQAHAQRRHDDIGIACGKRADTELSLPWRGGGSNISRNGSARGKRGESELLLPWRRDSSPRFRKKPSIGSQARPQEVSMTSSRKSRRHEAANTATAKRFVRVAVASSAADRFTPVSSAIEDRGSIPADVTLSLF